MKWMAIVAVCVAGAQAAEIQIPDACDSGLCLTGVRWKRGLLENTLSGFVGPETGTAESVSISMGYADKRREGTGFLHIRSVAPRTPFYFKIMNVRWEDSTIHIVADAVFGIEPMEKEGLVCKFTSLGSRLAVAISNRDSADMVLDYQFLTLTADGQSMRLNGGKGKFIDLATPATPALIVAGTEHKDELLPVGSATFQDGEWVEDWRLQDALRKHPTLTLPIGPHGAPRLEKVPLEVRSAIVATSGKVPPKVK